MVKRKVKKERKLSEYQHGLPCLAKIKGYPWWPSRIDFVRASQCPHRLQGPVLMAERDFKHPVFFYGTHQISWINYENLRPLDFEKAKEYCDGRKRTTKKLKIAFQEALTKPWVKLQFGDENGDFVRKERSKTLEWTQRWIDGATEEVENENEDWQALTRVKPLQ